jgi:hypothetical protein
MYKLFDRFYKRDLFEGGNFSYGVQLDSIKHLQLRELLQMYEGASFNNGIYRIVRCGDIPFWTSCIAAVFPELSQRIVPFGYDWLGRFFCLDMENDEDSTPHILLFSGLTNEVMTIPTNIVEFHEKILIEQSEAALEVERFSNFLTSSNISDLNATSCADMIVPLYMGGAYSVDNMKLSELAISWEINAQLLDQMKNIPEGTQIKKVSVS